MKPLHYLLVASAIALGLLALPHREPNEKGSMEPGHASRVEPASAPRQEQAEDDSPRARAEERYAEGSFQLCHRLYQEMAEQELSAEERRWVEFRLADTRWRAASATNDPDTTELDRARAELERLIAAVQREEERDRVWLEAHESLGRFHWSRARSQNWGQAWPHFQVALDGWAGSSEIDLARRRYLDLVFDCVQPAWYRASWGHGGYQYLPVEALENAVEIADSEDDRARARFLLGSYYCNYGQNVQFRGRAERELSAVIELGKRSEWYDDALFKLAAFLENTGRARRNADGAWVWTQDYVGAVALYRRILSEFERGETSWYDNAQSRVRQITEPHLWIAVDQFFLPGSEISYRIQWRNVHEVELALYPADLTRDVRFEETSVDGWLSAIQLDGLEAERRWKHATGDAREHRPDQTLLTLDEKLAPGAWVLVASARGKVARALVLVSDVALTAKATGDKVLAWLTDVETGRPVAEARVRLWQHYWHDGSWRWRERSGATGEDGTLLFDLGHTPSHSQYFLAAAAPRAGNGEGASEGAGDRQAFVQHGVQASRAAAREWRLYAFTDRSTYRPGHEVSWKLFGRRYDGSTYSTPAGAELEWELVDPLGSTVEKGKCRLDAFGAAWSKIATEESMALGEYRVQFHELTKERGREHVGSATLFRLEEYKLPEFEVVVDVPEEPEGSGRPKLFQTGDRVEVEVAADYYFGGPVAEASVEVFVWQKPHVHTWTKEREFPWFYEPAYRHWYGGHGQQISHQILKTDADGHCVVAFDTPANGSGDFEYTIEARVVDASRREILGRGTVRVTRSEYYARVEAGHAIHRPAAAVDLEFTTVDANGNPVVARGRAEVTRERWIEVWRDPSGRRVRGAELARMRDDRGFPPADWVLDSRGYEKEVVATTELSTGEDGEAAWVFTPDRDGYYQVAWRGVDSRGGDVEAFTSVFVADESTRELGYLPGGIEILVDEDTVVVGEETPILLVAPASGRWVLFTVEGDDLYHHEVVRLDGSVKLMRLAVTETHVPNVHLGAVSVAGGEAFADSVELIVPPVRQFLDVSLTHDRETVLPGERGSLSVTVRDHTGEPIAAQLALAVVDASLAYVQGDYAGDPRRFFYGQKRALLVTTHGSVHHGRYRRLAKNELGEVFDERDAGGKGGYFRDEQSKLGARLDDDGWEKEEGRQRFAKRASHAQAPGVASNRPAEEAFEADALASGRLEQGAGEPAAPPAPGQEPAVRVRSDFRETALWMAAVTTDERGRATVEVPFPDSTTRWSTTVRAADTGARFGIGRSEVRTRQPLIARLQGPRFFLAGDEVTVSGNLNNNTERPLSVRAALEVLDDGGLELLGRIDGGRLVAAAETALVVPAEGQVRVDWRLRVLAPGEARLRLSAVGEELGDAVEKAFPVYPHGIEALEARSGRFDGDEIAFSIDLPAERGADTTSLSVQVTPSIAVTMLDALPYLVDYPYGCTEQTLSRFLPTVIVARTLRERGLSPEEALGRVFGGIEREHVEHTQPGGRKALERLDEMVAQGLARLYDFQHADGGWAWWKTGDSDRFMTAYVLWGLSLARDAGIDVRAGVLENAARWLARELVEEEARVDEQAWLLHALAVYGAETGDPRSGRWAEQAFDNLWENRGRLNAYGRALFAIAAVHMGREEEARVLADNLIDGAIVDATPDASIVQVDGGASDPFVLKTAHWGEDGIFHRWSDGGVEATAFALRALVTVDPDHELVDPAMNWLVKNRRGAQWSNTRDTAITVLALDDYLRASGELASDVGFEVLVNGTSVAERALTAAELLGAPSRFEIDPASIRDGANEIRIRRTQGDGPLYFAAYARFFSREEPIPARGNELFVRREYYKLVGRPTLLKGFVYDRVPMRDGESVKSGERIEVIVTAEAKNHLEYLVFEDLKPAGFEAVQVRSGEPATLRELKRGEAERRFTGADGERARAGAPRGAYDPGHGRLHQPGYTGRTRAVHQELRDRKVAFFVDKMADGLWELRYDLRAETPGRFHALPLLAHAMYVPEIRANGQELRVDVLE